jgi:drug/metabolite transporter, DME family
LKPDDRSSQTTAGRRPFEGAALVVSAAAMWATFGTMARLLYARGFTAMELASVRTWIALIGAAAIAIATRERLRVPVRSIPFFAAYGILGFAAFEVLLLLSLQYVSVPVAISFLYTAPVFVLILARVLYAEPVTPLKIAALLLSISGVVFVSGAAGIVLHGQATIPAAGLWLGLGAGAGYALYTLFGRAAASRATPLASVFWSFLFAALALAAVQEPVGPLLRDPGSVPLLLALGIVPTLLPYLLFLRALRTVPAGTASMLACSEPLFAAFIAMIVVGDRMTAMQAAGMTLIVAASVLLAIGGGSGRPEGGT